MLSPVQLPLPLISLPAGVSSKVPDCYCSAEERQGYNSPSCCLAHKKNFLKNRIYVKKSASFSLFIFIAGSDLPTMFPALHRAQHKSWVLTQHQKLCWKSHGRWFACKGSSKAWVQASWETSTGAQPRMKAAAWLCLGPLGCFAAGGESRRPREAGLRWGARLDAQSGDGGPKHWDAVWVMDRGRRSHRPALPGCPVPKLHGDAPVNRAPRSSKSRIFPSHWGHQWLVPLPAFPCARRAAGHAPCCKPTTMQPQQPGLHNSSPPTSRFWPHPGSTLTQPWQSLTLKQTQARRVLASSAPRPVQQGTRRGLRMR